MQSETRFKMTNIQFLKVILCVLTFGVLMALRTEVNGIWLRGIVAACAFGALGLGLMWSWKK